MQCFNPHWLHYVAAHGACSVAEMTLSKPMPGDAVRLIRRWDWGMLDPGRIGVIEGVVGEPRDGYSITFNYSAFRGTSNGRPHETRQIVSCSGGPGTIHTPASDLIPTGKTMLIRFWRWGARGVGAGNADYYDLIVPLWDWAPKSG